MQNAINQAGSTYWGGDAGTVCNTVLLKPIMTCGDGCISDNRWAFKQQQQQRQQQQQQQHQQQHWGMGMGHRQPQVSRAAMPKHAAANAEKQGGSISPQQLSRLAGG
jgi:transcription initiation factor TFIID subunit TAF12